MAGACRLSPSRISPVARAGCRSAPPVCLAVSSLSGARRSSAAAAPHGATVIVNDRADIARLAGAAGVHLGQDDLAVATARRVLHEDAWVGRSTHSREQIAQAAAQDVSYIAVGPVFGTTTKVTGHAPVGMELVRAAVRACPGRPVVAIGGITLARARLVLEAGATAVAVISDLLATGDPEARVRAYVAALSPRAAGEPFAK